MNSSASRRDYIWLKYDRNKHSQNKFNSLIRQGLHRQARLLLKEQMALFVCNNNLQYSILAMKAHQQQDDYISLGENKAKYSKTSIKKKWQLIDFVKKHNYTIYKASKKLRLSNSTAKSIINNFERYGTVLQKFTKNRISKLQNEGSSPSKQIERHQQVKNQQNSYQCQIKGEDKSIKSTVDENKVVLDNTSIYPFMEFFYPFGHGFPFL